MGDIQHDQILCFECVAPVQQRAIDGIAHVRCLHCGHLATLEKAEDDCFVFTVAKAISASALWMYSAHSCRYMPATQGNPHALKRQMIESGRVKLALVA